MMALYFGEILEPASRAIFEEFSDEEEEIKPIELQFYWFQNEDRIPEVDIFYIYCGRLSVVFAETYLTDSTTFPIGEIKICENNEKNCGDDDDDTKTCKGKTLPSRIYLNDEDLTCLVSPAYSQDLAYQFLNCIIPWLKIARRVIVFSNESCCNYKTAELKDLPSAFVKELKTSHSSSDYIADKLPVPNIVAGVPAAIASWCQVYKKDASLFVCYTDQQKLDSFTAAPYLTVVKKINPKLVKNSNPDLTKRRFYSNPDVIGGPSNIYI